MKYNSDGENTSEKRTTIQSVARAVDILECVARARGGLLAKEVASEVGINLSTCYHLLNTLEQSGYIRRSKSGYYSLGHKIPYLNNAYMNHLRETQLFREIAFDLRNELEETVYLGGVVDGVIVMTDIFESPQALKVHTLHIGFHSFPHARAMTKGILAFWPRKEAIEYLRKHASYEKLTSRTPATEGEVLKQLDQIARDGYFIDNEEFADGINGVMFPIFSSDGAVVHGIGSTVPSERFLRRREVLIESVRIAASKASKLLGHRYK